MKYLIFGFFCYSLGILTMGGNIYNVQENIVYIIGLWGMRKIFDKVVLEPAAKEMRIPTRKVVKNVAVGWLQKRVRKSKTFSHYLRNHTGKAYNCGHCYE